MGLFTTTTALETRFPGTSFSGLTTLAAECCTEAEDKIRERLSARYDMSSATFNTTTSIPPACRTMSNWYALGLLYNYNARGSKESMARGDAWIKRANDNIDQILDFDANLSDTSGSLISEDSTRYDIKSSTVDYTETFAEDGELGQSVDTDKLDDIDAARD